MLRDIENCPDINCPCQTDSFSTTKECPTCGRRLRLGGQSQLLKFRLTCPNCGYQSGLLPQPEIQELL